MALEAVDKGFFRDFSGRIGPEIDLAAEEQKASPVVAEGAEAACRVLQGQFGAVESFRRGIRDSVDRGSRSRGWVDDA
jgi:hypothetical protein